MSDNTQRFSDKVDFYHRFRPNYPEELYDFLLCDFDDLTGVNIAEIVSGTGIFTKPLLKQGVQVLGVEPNEPMRLRAEQELKQFPNFYSFGGTAEHTGLTSASIDMICIAQAFHWFHPKQSKAEFQRMLKPGGRVAIIWHERLDDIDDFHKDYEGLLQQYSVDYKQVDHRNFDSDRVKTSFGNEELELRAFDHGQVLDREALIGRLLSCSYIPKAQEPGYRELLRETENLFDLYSKNGRVNMHYRAVLFFGQLV